MFQGFLKEYLKEYSERGEGRWKERERNIHWLPLTCPQLGTWPTTQASVLTGNQLDPQPCGSHTSAQSTEPRQPGHVSDFESENIESFCLKTVRLWCCFTVSIKIQWLQEIKTHSDHLWSRGMQQTP